MAVLDFHTHIFPDSIAKRARASLIESARGLYHPDHDMTLQSLLENMERCGVDKSVVQPVLTKQSQAEKVNAWAASLESDKIIPFGGLYPTEEHYKEDIDFICSLGLKGIKMHCEYQHFQVDSPLMLRLYDYAFSKGLIILHHAGFDPAFPPPFNSSPKQFLNVWKQMRGGIMVAAHLGGHAQWEDVIENLASTGIYLDTCMGQTYYGSKIFIDIVNAFGADRILFASDSPWSNPKQEIQLISSLPLPSSDKEKILHLNAERLLGLKP